MAQLAIKAHPIRTKEVIEILEMLGGKNRYHFKGDEDEWFVLNGNIQRTDRLFAKKGFTLEEFLEKYPYKVGDKVLYKHDNKIFFIRKMFWENDKILYELSDEVYSGGCSIPDTIIFDVDVVKLQPYKEETMVGKLTCNETLYLKVSSLKSEKTQIVFSADAPNETELVLGDNFEVQVNDGKTYVVKKKKYYPTFKNLGECKEILVEKDMYQGVSGYKGTLLTNFQRLLIFREAYWKLAGDWEPEFRFGKKKYSIMTKDNKVISATVEETNRILVFPTEEMRDAFYENFKELIELVKELL